MNKNEWYQVGEDIKKQVQQAIDSNDFTELSKSISDTVNQAVGDVSKSINDAVNDVRDSIQQSVQQTANNRAGNVSMNNQTVNKEIGTPAKHQKWERYNGKVYYAKPNLRPDPKLFSRNPVGSVSGIVCIIIGFGMMGLAGLSTIRTMMSVLVGAESFATMTLPVVATTAGLSVGAYGIKLKGRTDRFRHYVEMVKDKLYCSIEELADKTGRSQRFIRKDLKKMMQKGMFLQAHLDKKEKCFIASDAVYEQYMLTQNQYDQKQKSEKEAAVQADTEKKEPANTQTAKILEEGRDYIRMIRICNDEIPGEEMSEKLDKLELLVTRIFAQVEKEPELAPELQKMLSYYLPTTQKLLEAYRDLDKQNIDVKNISETKKEIETTVDTINDAFEKFLDDLFRDKAWDIQSDISVLNTMLKQDGYLKRDFETEQKGEEK